MQTIVSISALAVLFTILIQAALFQQFNTNLGLTEAALVLTLGLIND